MSHTLSELQLAYLAGFFDGEGCISILKYKASKNGRFYHRIVSGITQQIRIPLDLIQENFGGWVYLNKDRKMEANGQIPVHKWSGTASQALSLVRAIRPYSIIKRKEIDLALEFDEFCLRKQRSIPYEEMFVLRESYRERLSALNRGDNLR